MGGEGSGWHGDSKGHAKAGEKGGEQSHGGGRPSAEEKSEASEEKTE